MKFVKKTDIIILSAIIIFCFILWGTYRLLYSKAPATAEIYYGSELIESISLAEGTDRIFSVPQNENVVFHLFADGSICFEESDCRDKICIRSGRLRMVGETAVCLPNKLILKIVRNDKRVSGDMDMVIGAGR